MKSWVTILFFLFQILHSCITNKGKTYEITKDYLLGCETGRANCPPIDIRRQSQSENITLYFLIRANRTIINLYDSTYPIYIARHFNEDSIRSIREGFVNIEGKPSLNLTGLADGKYYIHILGDDVGGLFQVSIKTP